MADQPADRYPDSEGPFAGPNNTFPLNTAGRVRNAWARIHQAPTMANHSAAEIASIKAKIRARAKELGITLTENSDTSRTVDDRVERRATLVKVEHRNATGHSREIGGYAAVFNTESRQLGTFTEFVAPCAFNKSYADGWPGEGAGVICRYNHDDFHLLGSTKSGTLRLTINETGLDYSVDVPETRQDVFELIDRGDINQSSFAMIVTQDEWRHNHAGDAQRVIIETKLIDVAPVISPAYIDTTAERRTALRSLAAFKDVPIEDVYQLSDEQELRKLFIDTTKDGTPKRKRNMSGRQARAHLYGRRPDDPFNRKNVTV